MFREGRALVDLDSIVAHLKEQLGDVWKDRVRVACQKVG